RRTYFSEGESNAEFCRYFVARDCGSYGIYSEPEGHERFAVFSLWYRGRWGALLRCRPDWRSRCWVLCPVVHNFSAERRISLCHCLLLTQSGRGVIATWANAEG